MMTSTKDIIHKFHEYFRITFKVNEDECKKLTRRYIEQYKKQCDEGDTPDSEGDTPDSEGDTSDDEENDFPFNEYKGFNITLNYTTNEIKIVYFNHLNYRYEYMLRYVNDYDWKVMAECSPYTEYSFVDLLDKAFVKDESHLECIEFVRTPQPFPTDIDGLTTIIRKLLTSLEFRVDTVFSLDGCM